MRLRHPRSTRTATLLPDPTIFRSSPRVGGPWRAPRRLPVHPHRLSPTRHRGRRAASARHRRSRRAAAMSVYRTRILAAVESGAIPAVPGGMTHVDIEHAQGCRADHGRRRTRTPRITLIAGGEALTIGSEGEITHRDRKTVGWGRRVEVRVTIGVRVMITTKT